MKTYEYHIEANKNQLVIDIPDEMIGKRVKLLLSEEEEGYVKKFNEMTVEERLQVLETNWATAKYPNADTNKYDLYEQ